MKPTLPLPLHHSWPLFECGERFDLGILLGRDGFGASGFESIEDDMFAAQGVGRWTCDLSDNRLAWTGPVFDLFGLPRNARLARDEIVALYSEESRAVMERLRAYAIKHRRGFTVDVRVRAVGSGPRWMRLLAAPVCDGNRVIRLHGLKRNISHEYRAMPGG